MIRNLKKRLKKTLLKFSSIEYNIDKIKNISINFQQFTNSIISSLKSKISENIRKKQNILSKKNNA